MLIDLFDHCIWDEDEGTLVNIEGFKALMHRAQEEIAIGWEFEKVEFADEDESLFVLHFYRDTAL